MMIGYTAETLDDIVDEEKVTLLLLWYITNKIEFLILIF